MAAIPKLMKALVKEREGASYTYKEVSVSQPQGDELLVKVSKVALCGTDISKYKWNAVAKAVAQVPFTPGHEMVGEIVAVGADVAADYQLGKRVCVENHFYCGHCYQCTHGLQHICQNLNQFGYGKGTQHGGCSEYVIIPSRYAYLLKTDLDDKKAAILEPCGVAHQALEAIEPAGETILIQGCGPVGLLAIGIAKAMGATKIIACDVIESKLEVARVVGADVVINCQQQNLKDEVMRETNGDGTGRLVEATGATAMVNNSFSLLRKGGKIVLVGLIKDPVHIEDPIPAVIWKSLTLKTVHGRRIFRDWEQSEQLLHSGRVNVKPIITHDYPMSQFEEAFHTLLSGEGCKVLLTPGK